MYWPDWAKTELDIDLELLMELSPAVAFCSGSRRTIPYMPRTSPIRIIMTFTPRAPFFSPSVILDLTSSVSMVAFPIMTRLYTARTMITIDEMIKTTPKID